LYRISAVVTPHGALRLLQVGMGSWGRDWAWRIIPGVRAVKLVGCVDIDPAALALTRAKAGIPAELCFMSLDDALDATRPDAVLVTAVLPGHIPIARTALKAGKHVLVEKPFARHVADARKLVRLAAERDLVIMVSHNYRFFPAVRKVARLVREASLGELVQVSIDFRRNSPIGPNGPTAHHMYDEPLLVDMSIHHFDLLRFLLGKEAKSVSCYSWNPHWSGFSGPPTAVASIVFDGGLVVSYRGSWISTGSITPWTGEWRMEFERGEVMWSSRGEESTPDEVVVVQRRGGAPKRLATRAMKRVDRWATLAEFADAVRNHRDPQSSGRENLGTLALMNAAVESASRRTPVSVRVS
jgi:predicted dehydrogenase